MRGEGQHLSEAVASLFFLPSFEKSVSKVSPSIRILRVSLNGGSEGGDGLLDTLVCSCCQLVPGAQYGWRAVAEKDAAKSSVEAFIVRPKHLRDYASRRVGGQDYTESEGQDSQTGTTLAIDCLKG